MSRCLSWRQLRCLSGGGPAGARRRRPPEGQEAGGLRPEWSSWRGHDLPEAVRVFRGHCAAAARAAEDAEAAQPLAEVACELVEAIVLGIQGQLGGGLRTEAEVRALQPRGAGREELVVLEVRLPGARAPLVGEVATRSRVCLNVQIAQSLRFALLHLPELPREQPLSLRLDGLDMPTLPDCVCARAQVREELGQGLNPTTAYEWWEQNRHTRFPLQTSKFHRVVESLLEQRGFKMLGSQVCANSFWGYLHTTDLNIEVFQFHSDRRVPGGVALTAQLRPPKTPAEAADREQVQVITRQVLRANRASADRLAPSGINVAAMIAGPGLGQPGAQPRVVMKLLSAAQWWGPGEEGWHRWDQTWLCTDKKDLFGRVVLQQGRIIWRECREGDREERWGAPGVDPDSPCLDETERPGAIDALRVGLLAALLFLLSYTFYFNQ